MCEVTRKNFSEKYSEIINDINEASFISIDCEFSGLFDNSFSWSLFDAPKDVYQKLQQTLEGFVIVQLGLSSFRYDRTTNRFNISTYTFYLIPSSLIMGKSRFSCEISSIEFLCKFNFDFNKLFYDGISYLNMADEAKVMRMIKEKTLLYNADTKEIQKYCSEVAEWARNAPEGSEMSLDVENETQALVYILHEEIRKRVFNVWTYYDKENTIKLKRVSASEKKVLSSDEEEKNNLKKKLFNSLAGFSNVIKELEKLKKPIVGHNFLIDLMMIYKQFYNPSPVSYKTFKQNINTIFPNLYDTKFLSFQLKNILSKNEIWKSTSLSDLYSYLKDGKGSTLVIFTPLMSHKNENLIKSANFHEAGFDSYCTGFCFVKMAHIFSSWHPEKKSLTVTSMPTTSSWLLGAVSLMKNRLNLSVGQVNYIVLDGSDAKSSRPGLLHLQSKRNQPLNIIKITEMFAKYGSVDVKLVNKYRALVAVGYQRQVDEILQNLGNHREFKITKYSFLKHSYLGRTIIAFGVVTSAVLISILASRKWKNHSSLV